jgi:hypothetical protein
MIYQRQFLGPQLEFCDLLYIMGRTAYHVDVASSSEGSDISVKGSAYFRYHLQIYSDVDTERSDDGASTWGLPCPRSRRVKRHRQ